MLWSGYEVLPEEEEGGLYYVIGCRAQKDERKGQGIGFIGSIIWDKDSALEIHGALYEWGIQA